MESDLVFETKTSKFAKDKVFFFFFFFFLMFFSESKILRTLTGDPGKLILSTVLNDSPLKLWSSNEHPTKLFNSIAHKIWNSKFFSIWWRRFEYSGKRKKKKKKIPMTDKWDTVLGFSFKNNVLILFSLIGKRDIDKEVVIGPLFLWFHMSQKKIEKKVKMSQNYKIFEFPWAIKNNPLEYWMLVIGALTFHKIQIRINKSLSMKWINI